jgi:putative tryptophan/tyrosine transport system substrate-binding protein
LKTIYFFLICILIGCSSNEHKNVPVIGFLDLLQDETLAQAKSGFFDALKESGYDESDKTLEVIYRNAQGDQPALLQACDYLISKNVDLIATNPTLSTIAAVQKTGEIPVFMMVSPRPDLAGLTDKNGKAPQNLFGVFETLDYIDTSLMLIKQVLPTVKKLGTIYNQSEPQSVDALNEIKKSCMNEGIELISMPVNSSNETQLVVESLLGKKIDAFFALPDNVVFSSMEIIVKSCDASGVPVFTSEEGLVKRGALAAFGADMYQWGFQAGKQAAVFLKQKSVNGLQPSIVNTRRRVFNPEKAKKFNVQFDSTFTAVN